MRRVLVVGSGVAGVAAAWSAARDGAAVTLVASGPGATVLAGGAIDLAPWEASSPEHAPLDARARQVLDALGAFRLGEPGVLLATHAGTLRPARGADLALLDLAPLHDGSVLVPAVDHGPWDAASLARFWTESPAARARSLTFQAIPARLRVHTADRGLPDVDLAAPNDAPEHLDALAGRLIDAIKGAPPALGVLLPSWLGVARARAAELSAKVGLPCGEAMSGPGGPSGLRFEAARDRALEAAGVARRAGWVLALSFFDGWRATLESGEELPAADAVVLATGGLVGGGLAYGGSALGSASTHPAPLVRAAIDAPVTVGADGARLEPPSTMFGSSPETHAWPFADPSLLERAGVLAGEDGAVTGAPAGLFVAGEVVADRRRTWLDALSQGARAGEAAARARG